MAFIRLVLTNQLNSEETDVIINTDFIVSIENGDKPIIYYTSNGFEKETSVSIVQNYTFNELQNILVNRKKEFDPLQ